MANTFAPFGFRYFNYQAGSPTVGLTKALLQSSNATALYKGDLVQDSTTAGGYVTALTTGLGAVPTRGVFDGCSYYDVGSNSVIQGYFPGSLSTAVGDVTCYIVDDPNTWWIAQASTNAVVGSSIVGFNIGVITGSTGNTLTGQGRASIASSQTVIGATNALPFRIMDVYSNWAPPGTNGTDNTVAGAILVVQPNNWSNKNLTARTS